jgi:5-hydroxyisourate hydrolase
MELHVSEGFLNVRALGKQGEGGFSSGCSNLIIFLISCPQDRNLLICSMMEKLSTHVLDTHSGMPAAGVGIQLFKAGQLLVETRTNADGRCDSPLLMTPDAGQYELRFFIGEYFRSRGVDSPFLDVVPVVFSMVAGQSYHVPLLVTPWSYSTYRGS